MPYHPTAGKADGLIPESFSSISSFKSHLMLKLRVSEFSLLDCDITPSRQAWRTERRPARRSRIESGLNCYM